MPAIDYNLMILVGAVAIYGAFCVMLGAGIGLIYMRQSYRYGSTEGSRNKDTLIGDVVKRVPPPVVVQLPPPIPPQLPPPPITTTATTTLSGKMSFFAGPDDTGMTATEGLALFEESEAHLISGFLLPQQPGIGLGRRLDPSKNYIACRWDYKTTPRSFLQNIGVHVTNAAGKTIVCRPVDWGPNANTGRICDLSPGACKALGISTDDVVTVTIPLPPGNIYSSQVAANNSSEPLWLTAARAEIGFHEQPNNTGIQKYTTLAGYGSEGDPWCSIFAGAMLRKAGVPITGVNAMARSFTTSPAFTKLDGYRKGAVAVFWRGSPSGDEGHVGFADAVTPTHVLTLGGNENDQVEIEPIPKNGTSMGLLGYWWPAQIPTSTAAEPKLA